MKIISFFNNLLKKTNIFIIILCFTCLLSSCNKDKYITDTIALVYKDNVPYLINASKETYSLHKYESVIDIFADYIAVKKNGKYGFIDLTGKEVINPVYDRVYPMSENKAVVIKKGVYYIIDSNGKLLYTFPMELTSDSSFKENKLLVSKNNMYGYIEYNEKTKEFILQDKFFPYATSFQEGFAVVGEYVTKITSDNSLELSNTLKYNYIKDDYTLLFDSYLFDFADKFSCGKARVATYQDYTPDYVLERTRYNRLINTLMYSFIDEKGNYLHFDYEVLQTVSKEIRTNNSLISVPYATNFSDGYATLAKYIFDDTLSILYKEYIIIDTNGKSDFFEAIYHQTGYLAEFDNDKRFQSIMPSQFLIGKICVFNDIPMFTVGNTLEGSSYKVFFERMECEDLNFEGATYEPPRIHFDDARYSLLINNEYPSWMVNFNNTYLDGVKSYSIVTSITENPYEMSDIKKTKYFDYPLVKSRIQFRYQYNKYGLLKLDTKRDVYTNDFGQTFDNVYDTIVTLSYVLDPIYDKIFY